MDRRELLRSAAVLSAAGILLPAGTARAFPAAAAPVPVVDEPGAVWRPAATANYTASSRPSAYRIDRVVIHVAQETFDDTVRIFQDPARRVSAHYVVGSSDGRLAQCLRERDIGWHAGNWSYNTRSIGIEHEGWVDRPEYFTHALYERSAALTAAICDRYGIPKDRAHIIGHHEVPGADHTDPGAFWDWVRYLRLVNLV
ncbi:N-acetylmuramoyl-L-alanine amidase [Streptomyces tsukubensis]|uniref:N-acetylmuramoyl-L-alanine amidase n=1 Tax=Streptomyces tsukubensis (strain DSM 42081 / NBRC 108919 / NRRL 18488 / 9993) TaxID=1114943 RepID=A0A7G3ULG8_STRT9|nr:peptidoglycan recognition family protein [Streptomyces tsukubensis]AZK92597.1 N-acetylmuramoyl-L-alanine amidase [Streptomyces tsukubensis]QKM71227.1 N-acetylmuramoyl-L-alanine amidase [Streptomyces tsukubensis NRRL18488]TAI40392.1 N-acetylmuramoyl-L-alanine amidase [Streptomyces tsukubensis]